MPVYRSVIKPYLNKYDIDFYKDKDTKTYIIVPTDPDITVIDPSPRFEPVLLSVHDNIATSNTNTYTIPFTDRRHIIAIRVISGLIELRFHDNTVTPIIIGQSNRFERFYFIKHLVNDVLITAVQASEIILNVYEIGPRDEFQWL